MAIHICPSPNWGHNGAPMTIQQILSLLRSFHLSPWFTSMQPTHWKSIFNKPREKVEALEWGRGKAAARVLLTSAFIHAPGLGPDFERIWFFLPSAVGLIWSRGLCRWVLREHLCAVAGGCRVQASVAGNTVLGTVLAVFSFQRLLKVSEWEGQE